MQKTHYTLIMFLLMLISLISCQSAKNLHSNPRSLDSANIILSAWNEDTSHMYQLAITKDKKFYYKITPDVSPKVTLYYSGTASNSINGDTIFLKYNTKVKPTGLKHYLVKEVTGQYWIQLFETRSKSIFLRDLSRITSR